MASSRRGALDLSWETVPELKEALKRHRKVQARKHFSKGSSLTSLRSHRFISGAHLLSLGTSPPFSFFPSRALGAQPPTSTPTRPSTQPHSSSSSATPANQRGLLTLTDILMDHVPPMSPLPLAFPYLSLDSPSPPFQPTALPSPLVPSLETLPPELIEQIAFQLCRQTPQGPPTPLLSLLLVSRHIYNVLGPRNEGFYSDLFKERFDWKSVERRWATVRHPVPLCWALLGADGRLHQTDEDDRGQEGEARSPRGRDRSPPRRRPQAHLRILHARQQPLRHPRLVLHLAPAHEQGPGDRVQAPLYRPHEAQERRAQWSHSSQQLEAFESAVAGYADGGGVQEHLGGAGRVDAELVDVLLHAPREWCVSLRLFFGDEGS